MSKQIHYLHYGNWWYHFTCTDELLTQDLLENKSCVLVKCTGSICRSNLSGDADICNKCIYSQDALIEEKQKQFPHLIDVVDVSEQKVPTDIVEHIEKVVDESQNLESLNTLATLRPTLASSVKSTVISQLRNTNPELKPFLKRQLIAMAIRHLALYQFNKNLIDQYNPDTVTFVNGRHFDQNAIFYSTREAGVNTRSHETGSSYRDPNFINYQVFNNKLPQDINQFKKDHDSYIHKLRESDDYEDRMCEVDRYIFEKVNHDETQSPGCMINFTANQIVGHVISTTKKPKIVFFCSSTFECVSIASKWAGKDLWVKNNQFASQRSAILALGKAALSDFADYEIIIKCHPNQIDSDPEELETIEQICNKYGMTFIPPDCSSDSYAYITAAELCLVYSSTIGVECVLLDKPTLLLGRALYESLSIMPTVDNVSDIKKIIDQMTAVSPCSKERAREYFSYIFYRGKPFQFVDSYKWFGFDCEERVNQLIDKITPSSSSRIAIFGANKYCKKLIHSFPTGSIKIVIDNNSSMKQISGINVKKLVDIDNTELDSCSNIIAATDKHYESMYKHLKKRSSKLADKLQPL